MDITENLLISEIKEHRSPSVQYAIFNKDHIIKRYAFGLADIIDRKEVDDNTTYNAYLQDRHVR